MREETKRGRSWLIRWRNGRQAAARRSGLGAYAVGRILLLIPLVFGVTVVVFLLTSLVPGGPVAALLGGHATDTATVEAIRARYHLNDSLFMQYVTWVRDAIHGNLGTSIYTSQPVATELQQRFGVTLALNAIAIVISLTIGISLGMLAARSRGRFADSVAVAIGIFSGSFPSFVLAIVLLYTFAIHWTLFPVVGIGNGGLDEVQHLVLPGVVMALAPLGFVTKISRAAMLEQMEMDHVAFARARGVPPRRIYTQYVLRNALIPILTASGLLVTSALTATVFVEAVFGIPGIGGLLVTAVNNTDIPVIQGIVLLVAIWVVCANIIIDLLYVAIDPRVSFGRLS